MLHLHFIVMLLRWVIGIITYNEKGFIVQGCVNRGILLASLARKHWLPSQHSNYLYSNGIVHSNTTCESTYDTMSSSAAIQG